MVVTTVRYRLLGATMHEDVGSAEFWGPLDSLASEETEARGTGKKFENMFQIGDYSWLRAYPHSVKLRAKTLDCCYANSEMSTHFVRIQGIRGTDSESLQRSWGDALEFPRYYGQNWGAFEECFRDLLSLENGGIGSRFGGRPGRPVERLVITVEDSILLLSNSTEINLNRFIRYIDELNSESANIFERKCDLRVILDPGYDAPLERLLDVINNSG